MGRHHTGEQVHLVQLVGGIQIHIGMGIVEGLISILDDGCEHTAGLHVVAVHQIVLAGEIGAALPVQKYRAVLVAGAVDIAVQVVLAALLRRLHDGVVQTGVGAVQPAHHVGVLGLQCLEIHGDIVRLAAGGLRGGAVVLAGVVGIVAVRTRRHHLIDQILLLPLALLLLHHVADDLHRGKYQHRQQKHQYTVVQHLAVFALAVPSGSFAALCRTALHTLLSGMSAALLAASVRSIIHVTSLLVSGHCSRFHFSMQVVFATCNQM